MQRFQVHSHSQALTPTHRSLQLIASFSVQQNLSTSGQPFIGNHLLLIGGESVLIGSIFDVFSCRLLQNIGKI